MEKEIFKDIPEYEGLYQISNIGNVKSLRYCKEKILKPYISNSGYYMVALSKNKKQKRITIHKLVSITFLNHKSDGHTVVVDHINGDRLDNRVSNLQLLTNRQNVVKYHLTNDNLSSQYTGVSWFKRDKKWRVQININKKIIGLGYFDDELYSSQIYNKAFELMDQYTGDNKKFRDLIKTSI